MAVDWATFSRVIILFSTGRRKTQLKCVERLLCVWRVTECVLSLESIFTGGFLYLTIFNMKNQGGVMQFQGYPRKLKKYKFCKFIAFLKQHVMDVLCVL